MFNRRAEGGFGRASYDPGPPIKLPDPVELARRPSPADALRREDIPPDLLKNAAEISAAAGDFVQGLPSWRKDGQGLRFERLLLARQTNLATFAAPFRFA
jgi:hypothetical protein